MEFAPASIALADSMERMTEDSNLAPCSRSR